MDSTDLKSVCHRCGKMRKRLYQEQIDGEVVYVCRKCFREIEESQESDS